MNKAGLPLQFAIIGTGFWSHFQVAAWKELPGVELVALYNRTRSKALDLAEKFETSHVYDNINELFINHELDFVDIITDVNTHAEFTKLSAQHKVNVICQKPMAASAKEAREMVNVCKNAGVKLFVHENFRWQAPMRRLKYLIDHGVIGNVFKARLTFCSAFPVFDNQPFLADLEHFIITDVGSHVLDIARFLFGEMQTIYCLTQRVNKRIKGEDVANIQLLSHAGVHCSVELSYASVLEKESFPQTLALIEGEHGSIHLLPDFELRITTRKGTTKEYAEPKMYQWVDPAYAVVHSSIVDCNRDILNGLQGGESETTGEDNLRTVELVWAAYESAKTGKVIVC